MAKATAAPWGTSTPPAPLPFIAEATALYEVPGALRAASARYAVALLANGDGKAARQVLTAALGHPGDEPGAAELLLLRARAAELDGRPGAAVRDLLDATVAARSFLPGVAQRVHDLLDRSDDSAVRRFLLKSWAKDAGGDTGFGLEADLLRVHAAVLDEDVTRACDALSRCAGAARDAAAVSAASRLLHALQASPAPDGRRPFLLAQLFGLLGEHRAALAEVDRAVAAGLPDDGKDSPEAPALELRAELLDTLERGGEAGQSYFEAGRAYYWRNDFDRAVDLLVKATARLPDDAEPYWTLADAKRLQASRSVPPDPALLRAAAEIWEEGWRVAHRGEVPGWALRLRAWLAAALADADVLNGRRHLHAGVTALEDLVAASDQADDWVMLANLHRRCERYVTAFDILGHVSLQEQRTEALYEAAILAMWLAVPDAADRVDQYVGHESASDLGRGFLLLSSGRAGESIEAIKRAVRAQPEELRTHWCLGHAYLLLGQRRRGLNCMKKVRSIWEGLAEEDQRASQLFVADACYRTGDYVGSIAVLEDVVTRLEDREDTPSDVYRMLTLSRLASRDVTGARQAFTRALDVIRMPYSADEFVRDLTDLADRLGHQRSRGSYALVAAQMATDAAAAAERLHGRRCDRAAAIAELRGVLQRSEPDDAAVLACSATLARLLSELEPPAASASADAALEVLCRRPTSPAAAGRVTAASDQLIRGGRARLARPRLETALEYIPERDHQLVGDVLARLALAAALQGTEPGAREALSRAREAYQADGSDPSAVERIWTSALGDPKGYWTLRYAVGHDGDPGGDNELAMTADRCLAAMLRLDESDDERAAWPSPTPIAVEIAEDLVPEDTSAEGPMLGTYIPQMRRQVVESVTGAHPDGEQAWLPGVQVRADARLPAGGFRVLLHEVACSERGIPAGMVFCHAPSALVRAHVAEGTQMLPALDPVTRREATWVTASHAGDLEAAGMQVWRDPLLFVFRELEHQLRRNLDTYLLVDQVEMLRDRWKSQAGTAADFPQVDLEWLAVVVRSLVRERVPVTDGAALIRAAASSGSLDDVVDEYRRVIAGALPGNEDDTVRVVAPPKIAALVSSSADRTSAAAQDVSVALIELRSWLADQPARVALVAADPAARRALQQYVSAEFPDVPVLAVQEVKATMTITDVAATAPQAAGAR